MDDQATATTPRAFETRPDPGSRQVNGIERPSIERHYYISSLDRPTKARRLAECIRGHWSVENNLHGQLDVSFREDERRIRQGHGP